MSEPANFQSITDLVVKDISLRVAKLEMISRESADILPESVGSLVVTTKGDYELTLVFSAGSRVMRAITQNMTRGGGTDEDVLICTTEFFNILCGQVITLINNKTHTCARFGIPRMIEGAYPHIAANETLAWWELNYSSRYGPVKVQAGYRTCC